MPIYRTLSFWIVLATLALGLCLANWQYQKGQHKRHLQAINSQQQTCTQDVLNAGPKGCLMNISGRWTNQLILLDNQLHQGLMGYHIFGVMQADHQYHLTQVGWISEAHASDPKSVLSIDDLQLPTTFQARAHHIENNPFQRYWPERLAFEANQVIIPFLQPDKINQSLNLSLSEINLVPEQMLTAHSQLKPIAKLPEFLKPERHFAYALQWLLLALIAPFIYGLALRNIKKKEGRQ